MNGPFSKLMVVALAGAAAGWGYFFAVGAAPMQQKQPTSNQLLMRDKLSYATKALEGLSMEDYGKIAEAGDMMGIISRAASWHVIPTEKYAQMSKNFQEQARDLQRHAKEKNLDAASMDYVRITLTCVQCHNYMRENRAKKD